MRYENANKEVYELLTKVINENFDELSDVNFEILYDNKKKMKNGKVVPAEIKKINDLISYLSTNDFEYMMFLNKEVWNAIKDADRYRLLRHLLCHVFIDASHDDVKYNLKDHDFEAFKMEIEIESKEGGDQLWQERIDAVADALYAKDEE